MVTRLFQDKMDTPITDEELLDIAGNVSSADYHKLGVKLGQDLERLEEILNSKNNDYHGSTVAILMSWRAAEPRENWIMKRRALGASLSSLGIKTSNVLLPAPPYSSQPAVTVPERSLAFPILHIGVTFSVLKEIANNLETDEQMESLARALGCNQGQINKCHATNRMTGSVTTRGTVDMLTDWKAKVQILHQMSSMRCAMTSANLLNLRDTVLLIAEKQQVQEIKDCQRQCEQQPLHPAGEENPTPMSMTRLQVAAIFSPRRACSTLPTEGSIAPLVTSDLGTQPLTAARVASEVERMLPQINDLPAVPSSSVNIHGNVFNMYVTGRHDLVPPHPMIIPLAVRHELSKLLNGPRVTHDDWTGLASELRLDDYIASLTRKPDPTSDLIDLAEKQKKICSLEDLRHILKQMKRDDCVDVLDARASVVESNNRLMIQDRDRNSSSSDDF